MISKSPEETVQAGYDFAMKLKKGSVVALSGPLGAGKTVFVKGVALALGITESVISPTFTLVQEYDGKEKLYHLDLYRISGIDEFESMGGEDFLYPDGITIIEWSEKIEEILPGGVIHASISIEDNGYREIEIE